MKSNYKKLGKYISPHNYLNEGMEVQELLGISNQKFFQKSHTNTIGIDLSTYRIVRKNQFAFNRATTRNGEKISIALRQGEDCIVSPSYRIFQVNDEKELLSEYLMMWFKRPEFDRYARFMSHGSAHEFFEYDQMCEIELPIPSPIKQKEIVKEYNTIVNRINLNKQLIQKLEETAQAIYKQWFVDFEFPDENGKPYKSSGGEMIICEELEKEIPHGWSIYPIGKFGKVVTGKTPSSATPEHFGVGMPFITPGDFDNIDKYVINAERNLSKIGFAALRNKILKPGSVIVTCIGSDMGKVALSTIECLTNQQMNSIVVNKNFYSDYLYYYLKSFSKELKNIAMGGSTMPMISKSDFELISILKPHDRILEMFDKILKSINPHLLNNSKITNASIEMRNLLLSKLSTIQN